MTTAAMMTLMEIPLTATQMMSQRPWWTQNQLMQKTVTRTNPSTTLLLRLHMSPPVDQALQQVRILLTYHERTCREDFCWLLHGPGMHCFDARLSP
eukprot:COSAG02_NODE_601_length_19715_cov_445.701315_17_plen_96_part_00